ncbi:MAG: hypothetical protein H0T68_01450 [Gemmatimonadales bacterium]|nr:hypothetical protein [Gemmatimonadales bacterium]
MRINTSARFATAILLAGALACASNSARVDDETAAAPGDTTTSDTSMTEAPPGYSGMERDTSMTPDSAGAAVDTFLQEQGTGVPSDTAGYGGFEQPDTSGTAGQTGYDTTGTTGYDTTGTTGQTGYDTTGYGQQQPGETGTDTTGMAQDSSQWHPDSTAP